MGTIEEVRVHRRRVPLVRPFVTAVRTAWSVQAVLVELVDTEGRSGWGEAAVSWRVTGESPESVAAVVLGPIRTAVLGSPTEDPAAAAVLVGNAVARNNSARAAMEAALFDLAAQNAAQPLWRYLGARSSRVRTDVTLSALVAGGRIDDMVTVAAEHVASGFGTLKVKTGGGGDDLAAVLAVRDAVGPDVVLRVDANQGWSPSDAVATIRAWEDAGAGVELVEQPVHRDDLEGLAFVTNSVSTPIMADEAVWDRHDVRRLVQYRAASLINIKLAKTGGLCAAMAVGQLALEHGLRVVVGCMSESHVGIAAAAALASGLDKASVVPSGVHDLDAGLWLRESPVVGGPTYLGDTVDLGDRPGSGIDGLAEPVYE